MRFVIKKIKYIKMIKIFSCNEYVENLYKQMALSFLFFFMIFYKVEHKKWIFIKLKNKTSENIFLQIKLI